MTSEGAPAQVPVIAARNLTKTYQLGEQAVHARRDVSFDIQPGEFVAIMGPSGSGKSTLMNLIGALDVPSSGQLCINGTDIATLSRVSNDPRATPSRPYWRRGTTFTPPKCGFTPSFYCFEHNFLQLCLFFKFKYAFDRA